MLTYLFPGQGSQATGMGAELFDDFPHYVQQANDILGYSIKKVCLENNEQLNTTLYTQAAVFVVNALAFFKKQQEGHKIDFVAGHSLGEYNALLAADVFDFPTGLFLVKKRSELMHEASGGGMSAIIGLTHQEVEHHLQQQQITAITIANYNSYQQVVISGLSSDITRANDIFKAIKNVHCIPLKVSGAFHSPYMKTAENKFAEFIADVKFKTPSIPIVANYDASLYHPAVTAQNLTKQISNSVRWTATIEFLLSQGDMTFEEIGPGNVLTGLLQRIKNGQ